MEVFDFTSEMFDLLEFKRFNTVRRKSYQVSEITDGKIKVTLTNVDDVIVECIYRFMAKEEIYEMIVTDQPLQLKGMYVKDFDITEIENYEQYKLKEFDASHSFWDGKVSFRKANFADGEVLFENSNFGGGSVKFRGTDFRNGGVVFSGSNFGVERIIFVGSKFGKGYALFDEVVFAGSVSFMGTVFGKGVISFNSADFGDKDILFDVVDFGEGDVSFFRADFGNGKLSFNRTVFRDGNVFFCGSNFGEGKITFSRSDFGNCDVDFSNVSAGVIKFHCVRFQSNVDMKFVKVNQLIIHDCIIEKTMKCAFSDCTQLSFLDTVNLGQIYIDWEKDNLFYLLTNCVVEYWDGEDKIFKKRNFTADELASQFRMLKENFHNIGYYDDEDKAYYAYMHYKHLALKDDQPKGFKAKSRNRFRRAFYSLFEKIGGFGTKPLSVLAWAAGFIVGFGLLQAVFMDAASVWMKLLKGCYFSTITFFTIGYGDVLPANAWSAVLSGAEGFVGVVLMSYFTVALVRKLLR